MNFFYILNLIDFVIRILMVCILFLIFLKLHKIDNEIIKSIAYLKFDSVRRAINYVLITSPFFVAASVLEYPGFRSLYGEELVHFMQDIFLICFQIGIIYFLVVVYKALNLPRH